MQSNTRPAGCGRVSQRDLLVIALSGNVVAINASLDDEGGMLPWSRHLARELAAQSVAMTPNLS